MVTECGVKTEDYIDCFGGLLACYDEVAWVCGMLFLLTLSLMRRRAWLTLTSVYSPRPDLELCYRT